MHCVYFVVCYNLKPGEVDTETSPSTWKEICRCSTERDIVWSPVCLPVKKGKAIKKIWSTIVEPAGK